MGTRRRVIRLIGIWLLVVGAVAFVVVVGETWAGAVNKGVDYKCRVEGPHPTVPALALVSEAVHVHGYFSWLPLGRACTWERADGLGFVTAGPDWQDTLTAAGSALVAVVGIACVVTVDRSCRRARRGG
ncbi:hypothetical protein [Glaciibacter psychrotolerans]|uniref:DUF3592 domain-containing protein n=1 Tax=Glaciibacter psychrotolerans TaxID=670054 RepID=A0A7Z0J5T3_9MICO|nr:hypothetical protein [Leifsonia psychrotolerans]NYJ19807.1 hypothetical protein [Leifsonia psychrotolerans]